MTNTFKLNFFKYFKKNLIVNSENKKEVNIENKFMNEKFKSPA